MPLLRQTLVTSCKTGIQGANNIVESLLVSNNKLYVGGIFSSIDGQNREGLAELNLGDGHVTNWNPSNSPSSVIYSKLNLGSRLLVGGSFVQMGGKARGNLAAIQFSSGLVLD